jgi:hypothetical protein
MTHQEPFIDLLLSVDCYPLATPLAKINAYDFAFDVPLPARPVGMGAGQATAADVVWRVEPRAPAPAVAADYEIEPVLDAGEPHLRVIVWMTQPTAGGAGPLPTGFAASIVAGWRGDPTPLAHVRLTVDGIDVLNPIKPVKPVVREVRGWTMQASVSGEYQRLAGLDDVRAGQTIAQRLVFDQYLPADGVLPLSVHGASRKCIDALFGKSLSTSLRELMAQGLIDCLRTTDDPSNPGTIDVVHPGPDFGAGGTAAGASRSYAVAGKGAEGGACATSKAVCATDRDCAGERCVPMGVAYTLRYHIERVE